MGQTLLRFFNTYYRLDPRALALLRIGVSLLLLSDLFIRYSDIGAFYSEKGMWPQELMYNMGWQPGFWSIHALFPQPVWTGFLFILHMLLAICLLVGYRTRLAGIACLLLLISLQNRNLFVLQAGDDLLRLCLLCALFLNWGKCWSFDAKAKIPARSSTEGLAAFAYLLLLASVYLFTALLKDSAEWREEGSAIYYALSLDQLRLPYLGDLLYGHPAAMTFLTRIVYGIEWLLPLLILWPSRRGTARNLAFFLILLLHLAIGASLFVGLFYLISIATALGLVSGPCLNRIAKALRLKQDAWHYLNEQHQPEAFWMKYGKSLLIILLIFLNLLENLRHMDWFPYQGRKETRYVVNALRLNQYWGMFSPGILKKDGWLVYHGLDAQGRQWDLRLNQDYVDYREPENLALHFKNDRWRKLSENMQRTEFMFLRPLYAAYVLRTWNAQHPEKKISTLNLYFMERENLSDYRKTPVNKILYAVSTQE